MSEFCACLLWLDIWKICRFDCRTECWETSYRRGGGVDQTIGFASREHRANRLVIKGKIEGSLPVTFVLEGEMIGQPWF